MTRGRWIILALLLILAAILTQIIKEKPANETESSLTNVVKTSTRAVRRSAKISSQPPEIISPAPKEVRGTVVTQTGKPIQGVRVTLDRRFEETAHGHFEFSALTDTEGKFAWTNAPNQPMPFVFGKTGYQGKSGVQLNPSEENIVTLLSAQKLTGRVLDAETDRPVTQFTVTLGRNAINRFYPQTPRTFTSAEGLFSIDFVEGNQSQNAIRVSAIDYAEQIQFLPTIKTDEPFQILIKLKPSPALEGVVMTPNGQPVSGASVVIEEIINGVPLQFSHGLLKAIGTQSKFVHITDETGHFTIPSPPENGTILASAEAGFASATIAEVRSAGGLTLQLFGRIEGVFMQGTATAQGRQIFLRSINGGVDFDSNEYKTTSDANGQFTIEKVPAGTWSLMRLIEAPPGSWKQSHKILVTVAPGQTTRVTIGGVDATLQGRVSFESDPPENDLPISGNLTTKFPEALPGSSRDEVLAYVSSPEWKAQWKNRRWYTAIIAKDGSLSLDSVPPGDYILTVTAKSSSQSFKGETKITVPIGSRPDSPINVGEIVLKAVK